MEYNIDTLKEQIGRYLRGDDSALSMYKYKYCIEKPKVPSFPGSIYYKVANLIKFDDDETIFINKDCLHLIDMKWDVDEKEYSLFTKFKYDLVFVNTCRLYRINNITSKERLFALTAVEIAKKWKRAKYGTIELDNADRILSVAETVSNDVWNEAIKEKSSQRYYDATTLDSPKKNKLKFKYCKKTIDRLKSDWYGRYGEEKSSLEIMKWLDGQIIKFCCEWAIKECKDEPKENIVNKIKDTIGIKLSEKTIQKHRDKVAGLKRFKHKKRTKSKNQITKEETYLKLIAEKAAELQKYESYENRTSEQIVESAVKILGLKDETKQVYTWWHRKSKDVRKDIVNEMYKKY